MTRLHHLAAAFVVSLPLVGTLGDAGLAFTMYAASISYRIVIDGTDGAGRRHAIAPTLLASRVGRSAQPFFAGADNLRRTYDVRALRVRLPEVARLACAADEGRSAAVTVILEERPGRGEPRTTRAEITCSR